MIVRERTPRYGIGFCEIVLIGSFFHGSLPNHPRVGSSSPSSAILVSFEDDPLVAQHYGVKVSSTRAVPAHRHQTLQRVAPPLAPPIPKTLLSLGSYASCSTPVGCTRLTTIRKDTVREVCQRTDHIGQKHVASLLDRSKSLFHLEVRNATSSGC